MNLKVRRNSEGLPRLELRFDQDTSESEPYMVLEAYGFESDDEIAGTLMDVAQSLHNNIPVEELFKATDRRTPIGEFSPEGAELMAQYEAERRPGETVRDVERRHMQERDGEEFTTRRPFNPKPRGQH